MATTIQYIHLNKAVATYKWKHSKESNMCSLKVEYMKLTIVDNNNNNNNNINNQCFKIWSV